MVNVPSDSTDRALQDRFNQEVAQLLAHMERREKEFSDRLDTIESDATALAKKVRSMDAYLADLLLRVSALENTP